MSPDNSYHAAKVSTAGITSFSLKIIAIIAMTMNHTANIFYDVLPFPALCVLYGAGGFTFPIMAFLLVVGYLHTSNVKKYALRLGLFALVAQVPYGLFLSPMGNVLITLLISLGILYADDHVKNRVVFWILFTVAIIGSLTCDWGFIGVIMVYLFKVLRGQRGAVMAPVGIAIAALGIPTLGSLITEVITVNDWYYLPQALYPFIGCTFTIPLLSNYQGARGKPLKWFFYAYYPAHIAVLGMTYLFIFGQMPQF